MTGVPPPCAAPDGDELGVAEASAGAGILVAPKGCRDRRLPGEWGYSQSR